MKSERGGQTDKLFSIFQSAVELDRGQRAAFLDRACMGDAELRRDVEALLAYDEKAGSFIASPAFEEAAELTADDQARSLVGEAVGPFKIVSRLGSGGMGEVYLAEDSRLGRQVALKLLDRSLIGDRQSRMRFFREARLASALDHPNICTIHEIGEASGLLFIAMQYIEGETLKKVIAGRPLTLDRLLSISLQVGGALAAAHAQGIIHRDIKSSNIIITPHGQAKVLDFGLARPVEKEQSEKEELTRTGAVMGTPSYMSPEQARGERTDRRSDIYSFGVVMYEMVTGRPPFKGKTQAETMTAVINQPHTPVGEINQAVPPEVSAVIDRALAKPPDERYQSVEEMTEDLQRVALAIHLSGYHSSNPLLIPYIPPREAQPGRLRQWVEGMARRTALVIAFGVVALGLAMLAYYLWSKPAPAPLASPNQIKSIAVLPFKPLLADSRNESLEMGMADTLIARLSTIKELNVRPISAVRKYAALEQDALAAGREQKVDAVIDGQIQQSSERIRVTVRLVRIADGATLWASQFDEQMTDIFRVQDSISERVTGVLALKLTGEEKERLVKHYTENAEAHQLYLLGRYHLNRLTDDGFVKSLEYFQQAIEKDSRFALAHVGVAESYNMLGDMNVLRPNAVFPKARAAAETALKLDDQLADAHTALAVVKFAYDWDWSGAENEFKRAIERNPSASEPHRQYAFYLAFMGKFDEAVAEMRQAQELDPVSPVLITEMGQILYLARRYDEAIATCRKALDMDPNLGFAYWVAGLAWMKKEMYEPATRALQKSIPLSGDSPDEPASLAYTYALSGKRGEARKILGELEQQAGRKYISPTVIAMLCGALGDSNRAFSLLNKAYDERDGLLVLLKVDPMFDPLRSDARFAELLRRVGLTQ